MLGWLLFSLLSAAFYYLGSRALVTAFIWRRYPVGFTRFMDCAACTGFWYGLAISFAVPVPYLGLTPASWAYHPVAALCSIVSTPIAAGVMQAMLDRLGLIELPEDDDEV